MRKTPEVAAKTRSGVRNSKLSRETKLLCALFFLCGFPALFYQLVWQRALFRIFGVNIESVTITVTAFMIGLGLGSVIGGTISKRPRLPPLPVLAAIEFLTGIYGLFSLEIFERIGGITLAMPLAVTGCVTLGLVIVPTVLMGATLPILVGHLAQRSSNVGGSVGLLYYMNTLGAGAACLAAAVFLFPFAGMHAAVYIAAAMNLTVALTACIAHIRSDGSKNTVFPRSSSRFADVSPLAIEFPSVLMLAAFGGFISLSYEIFFFRTISYSTANSAPAFALTLGAFLMGLAQGAKQAGKSCEVSDRNKLMHFMLRSLCIANIAGALYLPLLSHMPTIIVLGVELFMVYIVAGNWGVFLPCLAHFGVAADGRSGMRTALLYLFNILGSAAGSILTGFVLMEHLGLVGLSLFLVVAGILFGFLLIFLFPLPRHARFMHGGRFAGIGTFAIVALPLLTFGIFENSMVVSHAEAKFPFSRIVENRNGIVTVDQADAVFGNGIYDGRFNIDFMHDTNGIIRPFALGYFHSAPRDVLVIGMGSGSWSQVIANNPEVKKLTIVEINPGYMQLIAERPELASVLTNPKVTIIIDDGQRWLRHNPDRRFDAVVSNTTHYFRANSSNLLSLEFLNLIKIHLNAGGVLFYNTTGSNRVQRTGCLGFPYGARFTNHMVASMAPIDWDFDRWMKVLAAYRIDEHRSVDVSQSNIRQHLQSLAALMHFSKDTRTPKSQDENYLEDCSSILARTQDLMPVTDDNMGSEWRKPLGME